MFHLFMLQRDTLLVHSHQRSNAKITVSMIKAKFGDALRRKVRRLRKTQSRSQGRSGDILAGSIQDARYSAATRRIRFSARI